MKIDHPWEREALLGSFALRPLHAYIAALPAERFPCLTDYNALLPNIDKSISVSNGKPLRFVPQDYGKLAFEARYEPRCYLQGEVQTRDKNWHDLFNALVWFVFPSAKRAINARHYAALTSGQHPEGRSERGTVRDMNTLFDESGVVVPYADESLAASLRNFEWNKLFWRKRDDVGRSIDFYLFGHGLYEKMLKPYVGLTGQGLLLKVEDGFFGLPLAQRLQRLDELLAVYLDDPEHCLTTRELTPVPLLGIPGWTDENEQESYYDNTDYFRSGRQSRAQCTPLNTAPSSVAGYSPAV
ncbi:MAG: DUF3025 domain-containing protein [Gammaproteobacteria bacterium]|nr:DUF3025 domain-containing protein [Gammaproteobacteria bacterium]MBU1625284.1 DUF3025 domain-containing protein [Gammaproteobacteria bacterium]MBU1981544.1 DUF3025 domain-containing protein [Gammaproteobacteria bacterium]